MAHVRMLVCARQLAHVCCQPRSKRHLPAHSRPDVCYSCGWLQRCLTCPTEDLYEHALRQIVYLGRNATFGLTFSRFPSETATIVAKGDSDWSVLRSTTGYTVQYMNSSIGHGSRRQHCVAMSSTEAELIAMCTTCLELLFFIHLLRFLGKIIDDPIPVWTDNKGAYDLCFRDTTGTSTRHVERKLFKGRELRGLGIILPTLVSTEVNDADMFTKVLEAWKFHKFRNVVMNLSGNTHDRSAHVDDSTNADLQADATKRLHAPKVLSSASALWAMIVAECI